MTATPGEGEPTHAAAPGADRPATRLATRLAFLVAGSGIACWAPLVPYAKARLGVDDAALGLLLLCFGIGSVIAMPVTGNLAGRIGARPMVLIGGTVLCLVLPALAVVSSPPAMIVTLLLLGASLGTLDVSMNVHAVEVERASKVPLMSGFHGLFSVGGIVGASAMTALLRAGLQPLVAVAIASAALLVLLAIAAPRLLRTRAGGGGPIVIRPRGIVVLLSALAFTLFLVEGAILDWGALLLTGDRGFDKSAGGLGYTCFSVAMSVGRLAGDRVVAALGTRRILTWGGLLAVAGFLLLLGAQAPWLVLAGFVLAGLGASNLVPVLFSATGRQHAMPPALAVSALTTIGYAGVLAGPALIGFVASLTGLPAAFLLLGVLVCFVPLSAKAVATAH